MKRVFKSYRSSVLKLFLINFSLGSLVSLRYFLNPTSTPDSLVSWLYAILTLLSQSALLVFLFSSLSALVVSLLSSKLRHAAIAILSSFYLTSLIVDTFVYSRFRFHINPAVLEMFFFGEGQVIELGWFMNSVILTLLTFFTWLFYFSLEKSFFKFNENFKKSWISALIFAGLLSHLLHAFSDFYQYKPIVRLAHVLPLSQPLRLTKFFAGLGLEASAKGIELQQLPGSSEFLNYPLEPLTCSSENNYNVVWVVVDSLRADMLAPNVMPNVAALKDVSSVFHQHVSGSNSTRHGIASMFYGLPGNYFETFRSLKVSPVLIDEFLKAGYESAIYSSAPLTMPEFHQSVFSSIKNLKTKSLAEHDYLRDQEVLSEFKQFLKRRDTKKPFFSFLFLDSVHQANTPPDYPKVFEPAWHLPNHIQLAGSDPNPYLNRYKNSVHFTDSLIAQVVNELKTKKLFDQTIFIFTSDHSEEFDDNGLNYWGHNGNFSDAQIQVPLLIYWPQRQRKDYLHLTSHYDLPATLLQDLLGCTQDPKTYSSGKNLFSGDPSKWVYLGTTGNYAVLSDDTLVSIKFNSWLEVTDRRLKTLSKRPPADLLPEVFDEMSRFYKLD